MNIPTDTLAGAVLLAIIIAAVKCLLDSWATRRKSRLERYSRQLEFLYGTLLTFPAIMRRRPGVSGCRGYLCP